MIKNKKEISNRLEILQKQKAENLMSIGIFLYEKIRNNEVYYLELEKQCESIKNIDKEIYDINTKLTQVMKVYLECDCGNKINIENKFCSECGKKLDFKEENIILCKHCNTENNSEFKFCVCCGNKIKNI